MKRLIHELGSRLSRRWSIYERECMLIRRMSQWFGVYALGRRGLLAEMENGLRGFLRALLFVCVAEQNP